MNFFKKTIQFIPLIYANTISNISYIRYSINALYLIHICKNYNTYGLAILDIILNIKMKCTNCIEYFKKDHNDFKLLSVDLYYGLYSHDDVTQLFLKLVKDRIDKSIIEKIYESKQFYLKTCKDTESKNNIPVLFETSLSNSNSRLKIRFRYKGNEHILYFPYTHTEYVPYPLYSKEILNDFREDNILPYYTNKINGNNILYTLFSMESQNIDKITINNIDYDKNSLLYKHFTMIQTPFNDFGILYKCPVKIIWIMIENNINIYDFLNFELKYLNMYFDEDCMDLFEHKISINTYNEISKKIDDNTNTNNNNTKTLENFELISDRMKYILDKKINYMN